MQLPRTFLEELALERARAASRLDAAAARASAIRELHELTLALTLELGRTADLVDVLARSADARERGRRLALVQAMRGRE